MVIEWHSVTWYSKLGAAILFLIVVPALSFYIGRQFEDVIIANSNIQPIQIESQVTQNNEKLPFTINSKGELIGIDPSGKYIDLVSFNKNDMEDSSISYDIYSSGNNGTTTLYKFTKGKVLDFWLSPDKKYISYLVQDGLTGCCASPPTIPTTRIKIMKSDGSSKMLIDKTPQNSPLTTFDGWLPDSQGFVFHSSDPDAATQTSPFYIGSLNSSKIKLFDAIDYGEKVTFDTYAITGAGVELRFSPKDNLMVYRKGGILGEEIILSKTDGSDKKTLLKVEDSRPISISWSKDGEEINVIVLADPTNQDKKIVRRFNKYGEEILNGNLRP